MSSNRERRAIDCRVDGMTFEPAVGCHGGENAVAITVKYDEGGLNYFSGGRDPRGFTLAVRAVTLDEGFVKFSITGPGRRFFLEPADRYNAKRLVILGASLLQHRQAIADAMRTADYPAIRAIIDRLGIVKRVA